MTEETLAAETAERLRSAIERGLFNRADAVLAKQCLSRLEGKVRVSVLGPRPNDATDLVNFIVGADILPRKKGTFPVRVDLGARTSAIATYRDDNTAIFEADKLGEAFEGSPRFVRVRSDQKALTRLSVIRASASSALGLRQMTQFAEPVTDVCLWITDALSEQEIKIWGEMPERLQHQGFLVIAPGHEEADEIRARGDGLFATVIELDPLAASAARAAPGGVDKVAFKAAGGTEMVRTIKREIDLINQAALDAAQVLLMRLPEELAVVEEPAAAKAPANPAAIKLVDPLPAETTSASETARIVTRPAPAYAPAPKADPSEPRAASLVAKKAPAAEAEVAVEAAPPAMEETPAPEPAEQNIFHEMGMSVRMRRTKPAPAPAPEHDTDDLGQAASASATAEPAGPAEHTFTRPTSQSRIRSRPRSRPATPWSLNLS